jgi:hypothetical protein
MVSLVITASAIISVSVVLVNIVLYLKAFQTTGPSKRSMMYLWENLRVFSSSAKDASLAIIMPSESCLLKPYLSDKSSHLRCWRLRSADQLPTGLVLSGAPGPHLQVQAASRLKLKRATHNNRGIDNFKTNNTSNTLIVLSKNCDHSVQNSLSGEPKCFHPDNPFTY